VFVPQPPCSDDALKKRHFRHSSPGLSRSRARTPRRTPGVLARPVKGPTSADRRSSINAANWGRPGATFLLGDEPLRIADVSRLAVMRKKMADGTAAPEEIAAFEAEAPTRPPGPGRDAKARRHHPRPPARADDAVGPVGAVMTLIARRANAAWSTASSIRKHRQRRRA